MLTASESPWLQFAADAFLALSPVLLAALSWLALRVARLIEAKVKHEELQRVLLRLDDAVVVAVRDLQRQLADSLRDAVGDGRLTSEERERLRQAAQAAVWTYLGPAGVSDVCRVMGHPAQDIDVITAPRIDVAAFGLTVRPYRRDDAP